MVAVGMGVAWRADHVRQNRRFAELENAVLNKTLEYWEEIIRLRSEQAKRASQDN